VLLFRVAIHSGAPPLAAGMVTLLFGIAPRLTESVFWVSGRTDLLASVFVLLALWLYREETEAQPRRIAAALCLLLGMLAKEVAIAGVVTITAFELTRLWHQRNARCEFTLAMPPSARLRNLAPIWVATGLYLVLRTSALWGQAAPSIELTFGERMALVGETLGRYALMILDPLHPALRIGSMRAPRDFALIAIGVAGLGLALWILKRAFESNQPGERVGALLLAATPLVLVLHLIPIGMDVIAADRFLYLPFAGIALYLAIAARWLSTRNSRLVLVGACVIAASFAWSTLEQAETWSDELVLWHRASLEADPYDSTPDRWIGTLLLERGHPREALLHFEEALRIEHDMPGTRPRARMTVEYLALTSQALAEVGRYAESVHAIAQAAKLDPMDPNVRAEHAQALARVLRLDEAHDESVATLAMATIDASARAIAHNVLRARDHWLTLPPFAEGEARNLRIARIDIFAALGATRQAEAIWLSILDEPDLTQDELLSAARFMALHSSPELADPVITRLLSTGEAHRLEARALGQVLEERRIHRSRQRVPPPLLDVIPTLAAS
jgi:tetratricopeptide (TPR) repeat protein